MRPGPGSIGPNGHRPFVVAGDGEHWAVGLGIDQLHSGDVGRFDADGHLTLVDLVTDMIIWVVENIHPKEIENVLHAHRAMSTDLAGVRVSGGRGASVGWTRR